LKPELNRVRYALAVLMLALPLSLCAHPLDGKIWDNAKQQFISVDVVFQRVAASRYVLLGEKHDSELHHARQLDVLQALAQRGVKPSLALEQFDSPQQDALTAAQGKTQDADALADAGQLNRKGWRWPMYKDLIGFAAARHWPLLAANLGRTEGRDIAMGKIIPTLPGADAAQLALLVDDVVQGHCGMRPDPARLAAIVLAQRARDARMAQALDSTAGPVVLIAGSGHVRRDRAVPRYLAHPERALSIGLVEIEDGKARPADYDIAGFDIAWFTPATERSDPCAQSLGGSVATPPVPSKKP
jgi:uncharacterized iron-regulated protein